MLFHTTISLKYITVKLLLLSETQSVFSTTNNRGAEVDFTEDRRIGIFLHAHSSTIYWRDYSITSLGCLAHNDQRSTMSTKNSVKKNKTIDYISLSIVNFCITILYNDNNNSNRLISKYGCLLLIATTAIKPQSFFFSTENTDTTSK